MSTEKKISSAHPADSPLELRSFRERVRTNMDELRGMRILLLDRIDDRVIPVEDLLKKNGFSNITSAASEHEAMAHLEHSLGYDVCNIDLILLDVSTPSASQHDLCQTIQGHGHWHEIPVIMIRSRSAWQDELLSDSFDVGATDIVLRPVQTIELIPRIISALLLKRERDLRRRHEKELEAELAERRVMEARLQYLVSHDDLTGLWNRRRLEQELELVVTRSRQSGKCSALLYIDLDQFKVINDLEGHIVGDRLLMSIANVLRNQIQSRDVLARISSDEYAILIENTAEDRALEKAEQIRIAIDELQFDTDNYRHRICASIGVAVITPGEHITASEALARSSQACFEAKSHGRNMVHLFNKNDLETNMLRYAADWVPKIHHALKHDRFRMLYQPVIRLSDRQIVGYEALIRMLDDDDQLITPDHFIPIAERMGLIHDIDLWVVQHTIDALNRLPPAYDHLSFNINLSVHAFQDPALLPMVQRKLAQTGISPRRITFEITETAAVENYEQTRAMVKKLRDLGCSFALDDFGTGFCSFNYLKQFPVDYLKIDGSFVSNLLHDPVDQRLVRSMIEVGKTLNKKIVAEYVENSAIFDLLREYGVDHVQGFHIGKPSSKIIAA